MRRLFGLLHRWFGLATALFLFVAGLTGALISWDHELDEWLNPQLYEAPGRGSPLPALALSDRIEQADPQVRVTFLPLNVEQGHTLMASVNPRVNPATGELFEPTYNQVAIDPVTGQIVATRMWGAVSLSRENFLSFLYKLHYSLHIPDARGIELGIWFMGIVGIIWVFDSLIALWVSFPNAGSWRKSFAFRFRRGGPALNFDLHRSGGVWVWLLLLLLATTSVSMNLGTEVMRPVVSMFSTLSPDVFASRSPQPLNQPIEPDVLKADVIRQASAEGARRGWEHPAGGVFYSPEFGVYGVGFFDPANDHGDGGLGNPWLYYDGKNGKLVGDDVPGTGSAGDIFLQAQFPLHSGRILGIPGRIMVSIMGLVVATLSITGLVIWLRKRRAQVVMSRARRQPQFAGPASV